MKKLLLVFVLIYHAIHAFQSGELFIVVPGTWATREKWYALGGDFFSAVQRSVACKGHKVLWFRWLGDNLELSRQIAAQELAYTINCLDPSIVLHIIAHSHGVNVALGACQLLAQQSLGQRIKTFYRTLANSRKI